MPSWSASRRPNPGACVKTDAAAKAMKTKSLISRFAVGAGLVATYIWAFYFTHGTTGYNSVTSNGATSVSAGTDPKSLLMSLAGLAIYVIILSTTVEVQGFHVAPMWRRAAAFIVDFWFSVFTMGALFGTIPVLLEATRTGVFRWHFQRNYGVATDEAGVALAFFGLGAFFAYFLFPLMWRRQTIGCWLFRLVTTNMNGDVVYLPFSLAVRRLFAEFKGLCSPLKTFKTRDHDGLTFYDRESGFTVVRY